LSKCALAVLTCAAVVWPTGCLGIGDDDSSEPRHLIVSVGDSVASGEGNPAPGLFRWQSPFWCHRSATSGQAIAARELIAAHPDSSFQFVSFACSGATIDRGLLGEFKKGGLRRAEPPQLDRLAALPAADVDALMISIGANDVGFQRIVTFCTLKDRCPTNRSFPPAVEWAAQRHVPVPTLDKYVSERIAELGPDYDRVNARIPSAIDRGHVLIVEYFDPTRWPAQHQCPVFDERVIRHPEEGLVTTAESSWARDHVLISLNDAVRAAARRNGWTVVDGVDERFDGHGICAPKPERWVRTLAESLALQHNVSGTLHPNEAGHRATAALIRAKLASVLGVG
jgi:lysophospholipase L1-like esterase